MYDKFDIRDFDAYLTFSIADCQIDPETKFAFVVTKEHFWDCAGEAHKVCGDKNFPYFYCGGEFAFDGNYGGIGDPECSHWCPSIYILPTDAYIRKLSVDKLFVDLCVSETEPLLKKIKERNKYCVEETSQPVNESDWLAILNNTYEE